MKLRLIYGVRELRNDVKKLIEDTIVGKGCEIVSSTSRWNKEAVLQSVEAARGRREAEVVLIISLRLDADAPFNLAELISCQEAVPYIKIILIVDKEEQGTVFLND